MLTIQTLISLVLLSPTLIQAAVPENPVCHTLDIQFVSLENQCPNRAEVVSDILNICDNLHNADVEKCFNIEAACEESCAKAGCSSTQACTDELDRCLDPFSQVRCQCALDKLNACVEEEENKCLIADTINNVCTQLGQVASVVGLVCPFQIGPQAISTGVSALVAGVSLIVTAFTQNNADGSVDFHNRDFQLAIASALDAVFVWAGVRAQEVFSEGGQTLQAEMREVFGDALIEVCTIDLAATLATTACGAAVFAYNTAHHCQFIEIDLLRFRRLQFLPAGLCNFSPSTAAAACSALQNDAAGLTAEGIDVSSVVAQCGNLQDQNILYPLLCNLRTAIANYEPFCSEVLAVVPSARAKRRAVDLSGAREGQHADVW
ncbi:dihydroorotase, homodimeric type [Pseudohyphozyma bogoriensis]|nr:dihydroorotase, homodimeric type [Pseudohyphozyma bogoriensis]